MAEQVNQRIESMINELEQMRRTNLYTDEEIKIIARKRKEFQYRIQRRVKVKDDFVHFIAYELAVLEDISLRRKQAKLTEKKKDLEYAVARRIKKLFSQFITRFPDINVYCEYIKFCRDVGFDYAVSGIISQMLQIHGNKPKMWQLASKWENKEQNNLENARSFLLKGIHRHPESEILYLELFEIEMMLAFKAEENEEKERILKRVNAVWRNGIKNITILSFLFKVCDLSLKYGIDETLCRDIKSEIWSRNNRKEVWVYIAAKELEGYHWEEIEQFSKEEIKFPKEVKNYICVYEEALREFPDDKLFTDYIHGLLKVNDSLCTEFQKINAVKHAWMYGYENSLLPNDMYEFGIEMLKLQDELPTKEFMEILETASVKSPEALYIWKEKILLNKTDENKMLSILQDAKKALKPADYLNLWNLLLDNIQSSKGLKFCYNNFQNCEDAVLLNIKSKLLNKMFEHNGLKAARDMYEEFIKTPPTQIEVHKIMIQIEQAQEKPNTKNIRKCFECLVHHHGNDNINVWLEYINFETQNGSAQSSPAIYRRAIATLKKELVDEFIKNYTLSRIK